MAEHVTFFRMKVLPGKAEELVKLMSSGEGEARLKAAGWTGNIVGRRKDNPDEVWVCVTWDTSERYYANAESPEQNADFERMRSLLAADPEWFDCDLLDREQGVGAQQARAVTRVPLAVRPATRYSTAASRSSSGRRRRAPA